MLTESSQKCASIGGVTAVIRFSKALAAWIADGLDHGLPPATLILTLIEERLDAGIARALVEAFVAARKANRPVPEGELTIRSAELGEGYKTWHGSEACASWRLAITMASNGDSSGPN